MSSPERSAAPAAGVLEVKLVQGIEQLAPHQWDACSGADQPFLSHAFLAALEASGSACQDSGWLPLHAVVEQDGRLLGCAPMYLKSHSYGEYVFDWGWANAFERAGGRYYPKLQVAVPFTPVPGPRLLLAPGAGPEVRTALARGLVGVAEQLGVSSLHVTFCRAAEWDTLAATGLLKRQGVQYHWHNRGYRSFDDFLATLKSSKRKTIRKERARVAAQGLTLETLTGADADARDLGRVLPVLPRHGRQALGQRLPAQALLPHARRDHGRSGGADHGAPRRALRRRRPQPFGRRHALRPRVGLPPASSSSSTSRPATTRRSTSPSPAASPGSRPARRGRTSCSAATSPCRPTARTGSATRASAPRSSASSPRSAAR